MKTPSDPARRRLLKLGAAGVTAALGSAAVPSFGNQSQTPPQPPASAGPPPPDATGVIDPAAMPAETWCEAWVWRPADWQGQALDLNVVERDEPEKAPSQGQIYPGQFSFGGISPAPTIRMRGDETLRIRLRNLLGADFGKMWIGPCPDPGSLPPDLAFAFEREIAKAAGKPVPAQTDPNFNPFAYLDALAVFLSVKTMDGHCMTGVSNSEHGSRITNIHTHGLHVSPGTNVGKGTESDNVFVRLLSRDDWALRQKMGGACAKGPHEYVGHVDYEVALGHVQRAAMQKAGRPPQPDPPGTHWYHPHAHGSTHDQVSAGMAGFLIVEGDVDDAINSAMTGDARPDPSTPAGPYDYRERLVFIQRVILQSVDFNAPRGRRQERLVPVPVPPEGIPPPTVMFMRPGAVERWRILNGSVDGRGFKRVMVLDGQFTFKGDRLYRVEKVEGTPPGRRLVPMTRAGIEAAKLPLYQLAFDGITLVSVENGRARHTIKDLSANNAGTQNPLHRPPAAGETDLQAMLRNIETCFRDGESLRNTFVRPNEVCLATANRADVFFKAPKNSAGRVFTVIAQEEILHTDNFQFRLQRAVVRGLEAFGPANPGPVDVVVAHVHVRGTPVAGGDFDVLSLRDKLPPVPPYLQPIADEETRMPAAEARARNVPSGSHRTRVVSYSGYGAGTWPTIKVPESYAKAHPELRNLTWAEYGGTRVLLAPNGRTMAINTEMDLRKNPQPQPPRKYSADDPTRSRPLVDTAEEWVLYNPSLTLWGRLNPGEFVQPEAYPVPRGDGQARFWRDPGFRIVVNAADHPFHIHVNPMWVMRVEIPDAQGRLHNILPEPRWMDTVAIPRNGGRVVFRMRFADYTGRWIHHCHILMHEDMGMMHEVECVALPASSDANPRDRVAGHGMSAEDVSAIYPRPSVEIAYRQALSFVDPNPHTGQNFPGFELQVPKLPD